MSKPLEISVQTIWSEGRGRIRNHWDHLPFDQVLGGYDLENFLSSLIRNGEKVVQYLKGEYKRCTGYEWSEEDEDENYE